ncbi:MAG TPA: nucleotide disphospho-sugar-binding domain-containing protein [Chitinophagaceae bacterium]|nr:nucleotide disphospho-sugar-binding domain-containing protein [Chitinophagaceae bacterium]
MERTKVLFATAPFDGHFNPLTTLALALQQVGYDVRWYTQEKYAPKLAKLQIPHYPFRNALQFHDGNMDELFPKRAAISSKIGKLNFDIQEIFVKRGPEYFEDLREIHKTFPFELMVADLGFTGIPFVRRLMQIPVIGVSVFPLMESARELAPYGLGLAPASTYLGKLKHAVLRFLASQVLFRKSNKLNSEILTSFGITGTGNLFDDGIFHSSIVLQSGTPGFEYYREKMSDHIRFAGALLPATSSPERSTRSYRDNSYERTVLVTQGTVEKDIEKLLVPTLQAFRGSNTRVIVTTGGSGTEELRRRFPESNFLIEDFIPFGEVMPHCDVYISNGGYGGVLLGIQNHLPMVVAGIHEGKNEICARVGYFKLGINLNTETPAPSQIREAVNQVSRNHEYLSNVKELAEEFSRFDPTFLIKKYVYLLTSRHGMISKAA